MGLIANAFAGITDFFRAFGAKSYSDVRDRANSRLNLEEIFHRRQDQVDAFEANLRNNQNLSESDIQDMLTSYSGREVGGGMLEGLSGLIGTLGSYVGGTAGYATKQAVKAMATPFTKSGREAIKEGAQSITQSKSTAAVGAAGAVAAVDPLIKPVVDAAANASHVISDAAGAVGNGIVKGFDAATDGVGNMYDAANVLVGNVADGMASGGALALGAAYGVGHLVDEAAERLAHAHNITNVGDAVGKVGRWVGKGTVEYGKDLGQDIWSAAKTFHYNRNSRGMQLAVAGGALALMPAAYDGGKEEVNHSIKLQQMAGNIQASSDGGGTFLRNNFSPQVEDFGATGELVFALRSLRNGG